jgi:predicted secreted protein
MKKFSLLATLFSLALCGIAMPVNAQTIQTPAPTLQVTADQSGQTLIATAGTSIEVSLEENLSTGYAWNVTSVSGTAAVTAQDVGLQHISGVTGMVGASGTCIIHFTPQSLGTTTLELSYSRAKGAPVRTFTITIQVTK